MIRASNLLGTYRRTGADLPFGDPRGHHGVAMEGYFWRLTDVRCRDGDRRVHRREPRRATARSGRRSGSPRIPEALVRTAVEPRAEADPRRLAVRAGDRLVADEDGVDVDLGPDARLRRALLRARRVAAARARRRRTRPPRPRPRAVLAPAPARRARRTGRRSSASGASRWTARGRTRRRTGRRPRGFPSEWWWGQAQGSAARTCRVAFAGGRLPDPAPARSSCGSATSSCTRSPAGAAPVPRRRRIVAPAGADRARRRHRRGRSRTGRRIRLPVPVPGERRAEPGVCAMHLAGRLHVRRAARRHGRFEGTSRAGRARTG